MKELFENILNELPSGVWVTDKDDKVIYINKAMTEIAGAAADKFAGLQVFQDMDRPGNKEFLKCYRKVKENLFPGEYEVRLTDSEGRIFVHRGWLTPLVSSGVFNGMIVTAEDITEKDIFEKALKESEERFRRLIEFGADGILLGSHEGIITEANQAACDILGVKKSLLIGKHISKVSFTAESLKRAPFRFDLLQQGHTVVSERTVIRPDGTEIETEMKTKMMSDGTYQAIFRDITEKKRSEDTTKLFMESVESSTDAIGISTPQGNHYYQNKRFSDLFGDIGENPSETLYVNKNTGKKVFQTIMSGNDWTGEVEMYSVDKNILNILLRAYPIKNTYGDITGLVGIHTDITDKKKSEAVLKENEEKFRTLFEESNDAIYLMDGDTFIDCNEKAVKMFECADREEMINHKPMEFSPPVQPDGRNTIVSALEHINEAVEGRPQRFYWKHRKKTGKDFDAEVSLNSVVLKGKKYLQAIVRDITFRIEAEKEIRRVNESLEHKVKERTAQLETVNKELESFSYSVSHDLRAPVRHISGFTDILSKKIKTDDPGICETIKKINCAACKMERLIDDLLEFSKTGRLELSKNKTNMTEIIESVKKEICESMSERKIEWKISELPAVCCDRNLMKIVWENLMNNACKYTSGKEAVIEFGFNDAGEEYEFFIKDNGIGFSMEYSSKLFGVFQRLHLEKDFPGTGIGLATVKRIISRHGGRVRGESEGEGRGACFYFTLPKKTGECKC